MTATLSTRKGGTKGMPRELRHMKPATWSLLGRSQALLGGLPLSTLLIRQRKTMRVTVKSSVRYVPTSSSIGDKPEAIGAGGKESDAVFSVKMTCWRTPHPCLDVPYKLGMHKGFPSGIFCPPFAVVMCRGAPASHDVSNLQ